MQYRLIYSDIFAHRRTCHRLCHNFACELSRTNMIPSGRSGCLADRRELFAALQWRLAQVEVPLGLQTVSYLRAGWETTPGKFDKWNFSVLSPT